MADDIINELIYNANYNDSIRNIELMYKYAFEVLDIDINQTDMIEKIIYWSVFLKDYETTMKLIIMIYKNDKIFTFVKNIFYREQKLLLRNLIINMYINLIKNKEHNSNYSYKIGDITYYMEKLVTINNNIDLTKVIDEYINEKESV